MSEFNSFPPGSKRKWYKPEEGETEPVTPTSYTAEGDNVPDAGTEVSVDESQNPGDTVVEPDPDADAGDTVVEPIAPEVSEVSYSDTPQTEGDTDLAEESDDDSEDDSEKE